RGGEDIRQQRPLARRDPGLLAELALGGGQRVLVGDVEDAGGQLDEPVRGGLAPLAQQADASLVIAGDDGDRTEMLHDLTAGNLPAGHAHLIPAQGENRRLDEDLGVDDLERVAAGGGAAGGAVVAVAGLARHSPSPSTMARITDTRPEGSPMAAVVPTGTSASRRCATTPLSRADSGSPPTTTVRSASSASAKSPRTRVPKPGSSPSPEPAPATRTTAAAGRMVPSS